MDPLAQLKDIHLPDAVNNYPIAPGWWLIVLTVLVLLVFTGLRLRRYIVKRKAKNLALRQLANANDTVAVVNTLKWSLLAYFPRSQVAHLSGDNLKAFLTMTLATKHQESFQQLSANHFNSVYQSDVKAISHGETPLNVSATEFSQAAKLWLNQALPPKEEAYSEDNALAAGNSSSSNLLAQTEKSAPKTTETVGAKS
jgi:hypothetical protein